MLYLIKIFYNTFLLPPGVFIIIFTLIALGLWRKQPGQGKLLLLITFIFYLSTTLWLGDLLIHSLEKRYNPAVPVKGDVLVMLGGGATLDTHNVFGQGHLSGAAANRILTSAQLYQKLHLPIIVSGGQVFKNTGLESKIAKNILLGLGVPAEKIIVEDQSRNTKENAEYTYKLLKKYGYQRPILITSAFHMERSIKEFRKLGIEVTSYPTDYRANMRNIFTFYKLIPSTEGLNEVCLALKEYLALSFEWFKSPLRK